MEGFLVLLGLAFVAWVLGAPALALLTARDAAKQQKRLDLRIFELEAQLGDLGQRMRRLVEAWPAPLPHGPQVDARPVATAPAMERVAADLEPGARRGVFEPFAVPTPIQAPTELMAAPAVVAEVAGPATATVPDDPTPLDAPPLAAAVQPTAQPTPAPTFESTAQLDAPEEVEKPPTLEEQLGLTWLTRAGAGAFLLGALFFFKYAVDNDWISPWGREALGAAVGAGLIGAGEYIKKTSKPRFVHALLGIGLSVLFVTVWASVAAYELVPRPAAFVATGLLALAGAGLARRHKGVAILVLSLVAAFLNPVLLATGDDRPIELFAYLLVVTGAAELVAIELGFDSIAYVAMTGVGLLYGGWWSQHGSAYRGGSYAIPIAAVALFGLVWSAFTILRANRPGTNSRTLAATRAGVAFTILAIAAAVVLFDDPVALAAVSLALTLAASVIGLRIDRPSIGVSPLLCSALGVAISFGFASAVDRGTVIALLAAQAVVASAAPLVVSALRARDTNGADKTGGALAAAGALPFATFASLSTFMLYPWHGDPAAPGASAVVLACATAAVVCIGARAGLAAIAHAFTLYAGLLVCLAAASFDDTIHVGGFLVGLAIWAAAGVAPFFVRFTRSRDGTADQLAIATGPAMATLLFSIAVVVATHASDGALRASLIAAAALVDGSLAGYAFARRAQREAALGLGAMALALFAAAASFATSGASVTVLWAVIAASSAYATSRLAAPSRPSEEKRANAFVGGVFVSCALFLATLTRAVAVDVARTVEATETFLTSHGVSGFLAPPAFTNQGAIGVTASALSLLAAAWFTWKLARPAGAAQTSGVDASTFSRGAAILGYSLLAGVLALEVRHATETLPVVPPSTDDNEWGRFFLDLATWNQQHLAGRTMTTTLVLAVCAASLLAAGFAGKSKFHRLLGLAGLLGVFAKLVLWDVWHVERVHQVILLTGVGALLGLGGFLYARFGKRLVAILQAQ